MDTYRTEEEQIDAIKKFIADDGAKVVAAIVVVIASYFGYQFWQKDQQANIEIASIYYSELSMAATAEQSVSEENRSRFDSAFIKLLAEFPESIYASYATLHKAKLEVEAGELDKATQSLQWVVDTKANDELVALAILRLAKVKAEQGDLDKALALLQTNAGPFTSAYEESKGDIYIAQNNLSEALIAYKKAKASQKNPVGFSDRMLDMKIESLDQSNQNKLFPVSGIAVNSEASSVAGSETTELED